MFNMKFCKELYSKIALIKAAYNFSDSAYIHLDADELYYYVDLEPKANNSSITEDVFINEMLTQSIRHEVYQQTKNIRELLLARALATSVIVNDGIEEDNDPELFSEEEILKDWFAENEETNHK